MKSLSFALILLAVTSQAQTAPPPFKVSGFVDGYYSWNGNDPASHQNFVPGTGTTAERANEFNLNLAAVDVVREAAPVGFHVALVAGNGADVVHAAEPDGFRHIYQASVIYKPNDKLTFEGGIFPSHIGFESFYSKDNWNYTRSWLGEFSPYYQTGVHASYQFTKEWSGELHVLNGWQLIDDNNDAKSIGGKIAYSNDRLSASFNTFDGPELPDDNHHWRHFGNLIAVYKATPQLSLGASIDRGHQLQQNWFGIAGYGRYALNDKHAIAARAERYHDPDNALSGAAQTLTEATLTYEYKPAPNLILKLEGRRDHSTADVFAASARHPERSRGTRVVGGALLATTRPVPSTTLGMTSAQNETIVVIGAVATF